MVAEPNIPLKYFSTHVHFELLNIEHISFLDNIVKSTYIYNTNVYLIFWTFFFPQWTQIVSTNSPQ